MMLGLQSVPRPQVLLKTIEKKANDRKSSPWSLLRPSSPRATVTVRFTCRSQRYSSYSG